MAAIWKGAITFGLVNIPVELRPAVRTDRLSFRMLHSEDMAPIKFERVCSSDGDPVPWSEVVKGYEYAKGKFVVLTPKDFEHAALEKSKTIDIIDFAKDEEIDPRFFDTPYYLLPTKGGEKAYALLREAIRKCQAVGVGKLFPGRGSVVHGAEAAGQGHVDQARQQQWRKHGDPVGQPPRDESEDPQHRGQVDRINRGTLRPEPAQLERREVGDDSRHRPAAAGHQPADEPDEQQPRHGDDHVQSRERASWRQPR
jgi:DNA end-binding protein Ku